MSLSDKHLASLEDNVRSINLGSLLLDGNGSITIKLLSMMTIPQIKTHLTEFFLPKVAIALNSVVHPDDQSDNEIEGAEILKHQESTRMCYRETLRNRIGPKPEHSWKKEWRKALDEGGGQNHDIHPQWSSCENFSRAMADWGITAGYVADGFNEEDVLLLDAMGVNVCIPTAIGNAIEERSNRFAALTYGGYELLASRAAAYTDFIPPRCFKELNNHVHSLTSKNAQWENLLTPDVNDFRGFTSYVPIYVDSACSIRYDPEGLVWTGPVGERDVVSSDIVCFEYGPPTDGGTVLHSAMELRRNVSYVLPPFTLISVTKVQEAGTWEYLPGKRVNQRLITVRPSYMVTVDIPDDEIEGGKFAGDRSFLHFGNSNDALRGLSNICGNPLLTMKQEFARNDTWTDWKGRNFCAWTEYEYVSGSAIEEKPCDIDPGSEPRDKGHHGWSLHQFKERMNDNIRKDWPAVCAKELKRGKELSSLPPLLTLEEVAAIRLYTGPAYQPINIFLREVSKLCASWRKQLAHNHEYTYSSTVAHLCNGLRKLMRTNINFTRVFRGIRGELPEAFWLKDDFGSISATDFGFMSTSLIRGISEDYLGNHEKCVMWQIECEEESEIGFHSGADVALLSQYPTEGEVLFPPLTMLQVVTEDKDQAVTKFTTRKGANYKCIRVKPTFV